MRPVAENRKKPTMARFFPSVSSRIRRERLYAQMFIEDVSRQVVPIRVRSSGREHIRVWFEGDEAACDSARVLLKNLMGRYGGNDAEDICDAFESIVRSLSWSGRAAYEILRTDGGELQLVEATTHNLFRFAFWYVQMVPMRDWASGGAKFNVLSVRDMWIIRMPSALGGERGYRRILRRLSWFDGISPRYWRRRMEAGTVLNDYNVHEYSRNVEVYKAILTKEWGWDRRDWSGNWVAEYYSFHKKLQSARAKAVLRDHVTAELNSLLNALGIRCNIKMEGLPTLSGINDLQSQLEGGTLSFAEAFEAVSF
ncbi:hypothetical protein D9M68_109260 [compost metagenome]